MTKASVFKKHSPQYNILYQNPGDGYSALYQILAVDHPTLGKFPHLLIQAPPDQLAADTVAQYYQHYIDFIHIQGFLEANRDTLNLPSELDKFISGLSYSAKISIISREERLSTDPNIKQKFTQGSIVTTVTQYLAELELPNGAPYSSRSQYDDSDSDSVLPRRPAPSQFSGLKDSARTMSLTRSTPSSSKKKKKKKKTTRRVHRIQVDINDPFASLVVPDDLENQEILCVHIRLGQTQWRKSGQTWIWSKLNKSNFACLR